MQLEQVANKCWEISKSLYVTLKLQYRVALPTSCETTINNSIIWVAGEDQKPRQLDSNTLYMHDIFKYIYG